MAGPPSGVYCLAIWQGGLLTARPRQVIPPIKLLTDKAACGALKSVSPVQCGSQAVATNTEARWGTRASALLPEEAAPAAVSSGNDLECFDHRVRS